ncbi:MAG: rod shape-determining protein RodA, partial [Armatimonadetes bacterium]|nr:rod shape-determining protein RodA [Candidatus Hippobium faecium]
YYLRKQIIYVIIGAVCGFGAFLIPTECYYKIYPKIYAVNLIMLFSVLILGTDINGARRWFSLGFINLQPSEISKVLMIICLSSYLFRRKNSTGPGTFWGSFLYTLVPLFLIFREPDLGTSIVLFTIWLVINFVMGTDLKNIIICVLIFATLGLSVWYIPGVLKPYQRERIESFANPEGDSLNSGYHVTQSKIAIGSGEFMGKGFLRGGQRALKFIPEQHTDFVFTVLGEEWGFAGCMVLLILYGLLIYRLIFIALNTDNLIGKGIVSGIAGMFMFHIFTNIGMTLGIMPVTGLPLLFVSYGGTSLIVSLTSIGLAEAVAIRKGNDYFFTD